MSDRARLGQLRALCHGEPSPDRWGSIMAVFEQWHWQTAQIGVEYAMAFLQTWPDELRINAPWMDITRGHPSWALVRSLSLRGQLIPAERADSLAQLQRLESIVVLDLGDCDLDDEGLTFIARAPFLINLDTFILDRNRITAAGALALSRAINLVGLRHLDLSHNPLGPEGPADLLREAHFGTLRTLLLRNTGIGPEGAGAIADCARMRRLRTLDLGHNPLGPEGARALAESRCLTALHRLRVDHAATRDEGAAALVCSPWLPALSELDLSDTGIEEDGALSISESPHTARLRRLDMRRNPLTPSALDALASSPHVACLDTLFIEADGQLHHTPGQLAEARKAPLGDGFEELAERERMLMLHALLSNPPGVDVWEQLMGIFRDWHGEELHSALEWAEQRLSTWPDGLRRQTAWMRWREPHPAWRLVRHLVLKGDGATIPPKFSERFDPDDVGLISRCPHLSELTGLTIEGTHLTPARQGVLRRSRFLASCQIKVTPGFGL